MPLNGIWKSRFRFVLLALPRAVSGQFTATRMAGYALEFSAAGSHRIGSHCLRFAIEKSIDDPHAFETALEKLLASGQCQITAEFANTVFDQTGVAPSTAVRLIGEFLVHGAYAESLNALDRLVASLNVDPQDAVPAPAFPNQLSISAIRERLVGLTAKKVLEPPDMSELRQSVARLCFKFSAFDVAVKLYDWNEPATAVETEDQIAFCYALLRSGSIQASKVVTEQFGLCQKDIEVNFDWRIINAALIFNFGSAERTKTEVVACLRNRMSMHADLENIIQCCIHIVDVIASFPKRLSIDPQRRNRQQINDIAEPAVPQNVRQKIFVCGNGWSGSGALCDALADMEAVAVAPDMTIDQFINKDTNNELMFVQGEGGLGRLWRQARDNQAICRIDLWELFRCHVVGMGAIGFAEHKCTNAAASQLERHGSLYASHILTLYQRLAKLEDSADLDDFRGSLVKATDALSEIIFSPGEGQAVVFNNAMFGANLDMVEIFSNIKLACVVRDPLDQYADRREFDLKHWMSVRRFASFYKSSRAAFHSSRDKLPPELATHVREVQFERFVRDSGYRNGVLDWLLDGLSRQRIAANFSSDSSTKNIGIYKKLLTHDEVDFLDSELKEWRSH